MRLRRLDLTRYGHFDGASMDFGEAEEGPDVTVVFGPNEAGKSTAFAAWLDLLYGFQSRGHPYTFRFERKDLLVGAVIDAPEGPLVLQRTARSSGSLADESGREVAEHRLAALLHGLDRDAYRTRFSLDDAVLRSGGEEIATAKGDLGRLLHAGTSGLGGLSRALEEVRDEVDGFYLKGGSKQVLPTAKRRLKELETELRERRLSPARFDDLRSAAEARDAAAREAREAVAEARRGLAYAEAAGRRRALRVRQVELAEALEQYPAGPDLSTEAGHEVVRIAAEAREARQRERQAQGIGAAAAARLAELAPDLEGLSLGPLIDEIERLRFDEQPLLLRVAGAEADLARRQAERDQLAQTVVAMAARLGGSGAAPEDMRLAPTTLDLLASQLQDVRDAEHDLRTAREAVAEARDGQGEAPPAPQGEPALAAALQRMMTEAPDLEALREGEETAGAAALTAAAGLAADWRTQLVAAGGLPAEDEIAVAVQAVSRASDAEEAAANRLEQAASAREAADALHIAAAANPAAMDMAEVQRRRLARERAWSVHLAALDAGTADAFEAAMRADDEATATHVEGAEARALLQRRREETEVTHAAEAAANRVATAVQAEVEATHARLAAIAPRLLLGPEVAPDSVLPRQRTLALALEEAARQEAAATALRRGEQRQEALELELRRALEASGAVPDGTPLAVAAKTRLAELRDAGTALARWQAGQEQRSQLDRRATLARERLAVRQSELAATAAKSWAAAMIPGILREALPLATELAAALDRLHDLDHRISRMEQARENFETVAGRLREVLGPAATTETLMQAARQRRAQAERIASDIAGESERQEAAADEGDAARVMQSRAAERIEALLAGQEGLGELAADEIVPRLTARDRLRDELRRAEAEIAKAGRELDPARLAEEEAVLDPARRSGLEDDLARAEEASAAADRAAGAAQRELAMALDGSGGAAADQERAVILEELAGAAREAAVRAIGASVASAALRRLGRTRRGSMLADTEAAFRRLTGGAWTRLDTWVAGQDERLVGFSDGRAVPADGMSTGTRAQLYLALRIAGHAAFVREAGPLPFVTDDILESFDDARAAAALDLTAELGRRGQAILFTHHAHLVEMARAQISNVRVLELPHRASQVA